MSILKEVCSLFPTNPYFSMGIFGPSNVGKSMLAFEFYKNFKKFYNYKIKKIVLFIDTLTPLHEQIIECLGVESEIHNELTEELLQNEDLFGSNFENEVVLVLIDDLQNKIQKSQALVRLVSILCHHKKLQVVYVGHSIYAYTDTQYKTVLNNLAVFAISLAPRQKVSYLRLMQQIFGVQKCRIFDKIFELAKGDHKKYGNDFPFLFLNVHLTASDEARIFILPFSIFPIVYTIKE